MAPGVSLDYWRELMERYLFKSLSLSCSFCANPVAICKVNAIHM